MVKDALLQLPCVFFYMKNKNTQKQETNSNDI